MKVPAFIKNGFLVVFVAALVVITILMAKGVFLYVKEDYRIASGDTALVDIESYISTGTADIDDCGDVGASDTTPDGKRTAFCFTDGVVYLKFHTPVPHKFLLEVILKNENGVAEEICPKRCVLDRAANALLSERYISIRDRLKAEGGMTWAEMKRQETKENSAKVKNTLG